MTKPKVSVFPTTRHTLAGIGSINENLDVTLMTAGEVLSHDMELPPDVLQSAVLRFGLVPCYIDHASLNDLFRSGGRSVRDLAGMIQTPSWDPSTLSIHAKLEISNVHPWLLELIQQFGDHPKFFGLSAVLWLDKEPIEPRPTQGPTMRVTAIERVDSVDIVCNPAAGGKFASLAKKLAKESTMTVPTKLQAAQPPVQPVENAANLTQPPVTPPATPPVQEAPAPTVTPGEINALGEVLRARLDTALIPDDMKDIVRDRFTAEGYAPATTTLDRLIKAWANANAQASIQGLGAITNMQNSQDRIELAFMRLMGLELPAGANPARLSGIRELYDLLTGDWDRHGVFRADRVQFAAATTTTMAEVTRNVLNKAMLRAFEMRPKWWSPIVHEEDFVTMQQIKWITLGGFSDLNTVAEGDAYTEKTWDDYAETADFLKKGNYIGLTMEMIDKDDVGAVRAIPRKLGLAANRTLSSAVSNIFTQAAGLGPDLADAVALFNAAHGNLGTTGLSADEWDVVIQAMFQQTEYHSSKVLGVRPRYCLVPIELEKTALGVFTTTTDPAFSEANRVAIRRDVSSVITVPEWTDANNWAACCDPNDLEGICIGYRYGREPELFISDSPLMGSMFTNDEMRIKVRFVYAVGIGDYRALYKENVA